MGDINSRLKLFESLTEQAKSIMLSRAEKYSKATIENHSECNANIRACESIGLAKATTGVLIRMLDKLARLGNMGSIHSDESVEDSVIDIINYSVIFMDVYLEDTRKVRDGTKKDQ